MKEVCSLADLIEFSKARKREHEVRHCWCEPELIYTSATGKEIWRHRETSEVPDPNPGDWSWY